MIHIIKDKRYKTTKACKTQKNIGFLKTRLTASSIAKRNEA